jgi:chemotaxis response regulator CheB
MSIHLHRHSTAYIVTSVGRHHQTYVATSLAISHEPTGDGGNTQHPHSLWHSASTPSFINGAKYTASPSATEPGATSTSPMVGRHNTNLHRRQVGVHTSTGGTTSLNHVYPRHSTSTPGVILCSHPRWRWYSSLLPPSSSYKSVLNPAWHGLPQNKNRWAFRYLVYLTASGLMTGAV